jgi:hypothetical protein
MWEIFKIQSKFFIHPKAETMLEDLAIKGILKGFPDSEIVQAIGEYYRQCDQVAQENLERAKKYLL